MSVEVSTYVWKFSPSTLGARLVMLYLADKAHDDGSNVYPSIATIAKNTRLSDRQVQRVLGDLVEAGELIDEGVSFYGTRRFRVKMPGAEGGDNLSGGDIHDQKGVTFRAKTDDKMSPDPSEENRQRKDVSSKTLIPKDFMLTSKDIAFAKNHGLGASDRAWMGEFDRFMAYHQGKGSRMHDWHAAWRTWVLNQEKWSSNETSGASFDAAEHARKYPTASELEARRKA
jgi:Helix-turn-helix domain